MVVNWIMSIMSPKKENEVHYSSKEADSFSSFLKIENFYTQ